MAYYICRSCDAGFEGTAAEAAAERRNGHDVSALCVMCEAPIDVDPSEEFPMCERCAIEMAAGSPGIPDDDPPPTDLDYDYADCMADARDVRESHTPLLRMRRLHGVG